MKDKYVTDTFPRMVVLEYSYVCNSLCPACPYNYTAIRQKFASCRFMRADVFIKIIRECKLHKTMIRITGCGEPTLHPRLVADVTYAKQHGVTVAVITNGTLSHSQIRGVLRANVDYLEFSVDAGTEEEYSNVRPGLYWPDLVEKVRFAYTSRIDTKIIVSAIEQREIDIKKVYETWGHISDIVQIRRYLRWDAGPDKSANKHPLLEKGAPCPQPFQRLSIGPDGSVSLCNEDSWFAHTIGNVAEASINQLWNSTEMVVLRKAQLNGESHPLCDKCRDRPYKSWDNDYFRMTNHA